MPTDLIGRKPAATYVGKSIMTIDRWVKAGLLPAYRLGPRTVLISKSDLDRMLRPVT
jgi:excisionase family DNA binding protein